MTQKRYLNFGSNVTAANTNNARNQFIDNIVLSGGDLSALNNKLIISAISLALPSGIILTEDVQQTLELLDIPGDISKSYTIVYTHQDQDVLLGTTAILEAFVGLYAPDALPNSTILGWVKYPGGSIPLASDHIIQTRSNKVSLDISKFDLATLGAALPPLSSKFLHFSQSGAAITISDVCDQTDISQITAYTQFHNEQITTGRVVKVLSFMVGEYKPGMLILNVFVDVDAVLTLSIIDATGEEVFPLNNTIQNTSTFITREFILPKNYYWLFAQGSTFLVKLVANLNSGKKIKLRSIGYSTFNFPY